MTKDEIIEGFAASHFGALPPACISYARELLSVCLVASNYAEAVRELYALCGWSDLKTMCDRIAFLRTLIEK